jgi:hypothetical protein
MPRAATENLRLLPRSKQFTARIQKIVTRILIAFASGKFSTNRLGSVPTESVDYLKHCDGLRSQRSFHSLDCRYSFADDFRRVADGLPGL